MIYDNAFYLDHIKHNADKAEACLRMGQRNLATYYLSLACEWLAMRSADRASV